ncbi:MAG TPA: AI-2E family transporter [Myxococcaceae bacterium]|nr:AI-2E family transporter [Myxococcaceae bacterium]
MANVDRHKKWSNIAFGALFATALLLFGWILMPFVASVLVSGFQVVLFMPVQKWLVRRTGRRALSAGLSTVSVLLLGVVPVAVIAFLVGREVVVVYDAARAALDDPNLRTRLVAKLPAALHRFLLPAAGIDPAGDHAVAAAMSSGASLLRDVLGAGSGLAVDGFLMSVSMYYFFLDGPRLYSEAAQLVPIERRYLDSFAQEFKDVAYAVIYGSTATALIQGALGLIGVLVAGIPHPVVWAAAMVVVALIPMGGTALVWLPLSIALLVGGKVPQGLFLLGWGGLVVSTADNLVRPKIYGSRMALHPLLVFLSMFGGLSAFGVRGLLVGPLIACICMAMVRIYRRDFLGSATIAVERFTRHAIERQTEVPAR